MAFLDNSGDIILDAILTSEGRRRMARGAKGNFIVKYAFGDDEIDYSLYNKNHVSGTAFFDVVLMQTPILEAFSDNGLQYQLMTIGRDDLIYMPEVLINEKLYDSVVPKSETIHVATNTETYNRLVTILGEDYVLQTGQGTRRGLVPQFGLNTPDVTNTPSNQSSLLKNNNLFDSSMRVEADGRFLTNIMHQPRDSRFANNSDGSENINFGVLRSASPSSESTTLKNYNVFNISTVPSQVFYNANIDYKTMVAGDGGPVASVAKINFVVDEQLTANQTSATPRKFIDYGKTAQALFAGYSDTFDHIDTTVVIKGEVTEAQTSVTLRIVRGANLN